MFFQRLMWRFLFAGAFLTGCIQGLFAQNNLDIYYKYCVVHPLPDCYDPAVGAIDSVGRDVKNLGGGYKFCLKTDTVDMGFAPLRVVIVLDRSGSMCGGTDCMRNDTANMRVVAARTFVDSLGSMSPKSEVGVVRYGAQAQTLGMSNLTTEENVMQVHEWIEQASCESNTDGLGGNGTNLGLALESALQLSDTDYDNLDSIIDRHVILLTDGAWDDVDTRSPDQVTNNYMTTTGHPLPTIHGVFLSDSAYHVNHDCPPQGLAGSGDTVDLEHLSYVSDTLTGGLFFRGSTPQTVVSNFSELLDSVKVRVERTLTSMTVTNLTNGQSSTGSNIQKVTDAVDDETHYEATIDDIALVDGVNQIKVTQVISNPSSGIDSTIIDTVIIFRTTEWTSIINPVEYEQFCVLDTTTISITVTPELLGVNETFKVNSTVQMKENFLLNNVEVRAFKRFPDTDPNSVAVFHLEQNLVNSANSAVTSNGTEVTYTATGALFDRYCISQGDFNVRIGSLSGDFTLEAWVQPASGGTATDIFSGSDNDFGIDDQGYLTFTVNDSTIAKSSFALDANTWSHIGALKTNGNLVLFINGMNCTDPVAFTGTYTGNMTIACPSGGMLDEVRISNISRLRPGISFLRLDIPSVQNISWTLTGGQEPVVLPVLNLTPEMWTAGNIDFQFSSPEAGRLVINFQHQGISEAQWSKNGNPVTVAADLVPPYITKGVFVYGEGGFGTDDTLIVYFSEPIRCDSLKKSDDPGSSFKVFDSVSVLKPDIFVDSKYLDKADNPCPDVLIDSTVIIVKARVNGIKPKKDSIQLVGTAVDTAGNYPDPLKKGPIVWGPGAGVDIKVIVNKDYPMQIPPGIISHTGITERVGKVVVIETPRGALTRRLTENGDTSYAIRTFVFDIVGNIVAEDIPLKMFLDDERKYYVIWKGTNRYGRKVGTGAYLFKALVQYESDLERPAWLDAKMLLKWK